MLLLVLAFLGGALTILSPCILPVIPFVFSRAGLPFRSSGLPMLIGMALTFAGVAALASYGGGWVVQANQYGRDGALALLALFALTLLFPQISELLSRPLVRLGSRLSNPAGSERVTIAQSLVLGVATGLLWAPCAGPILGLILTGAALGGAHTATVFLLFAYAAGAATSLAIVLFAGNKVLNQLKRSLGFEETLRRAVGVLVLAGVAVIALGLDRGVLTRLSEGSAARLEQGLVDRVHPHHEAVAFAGIGLGLGNEGSFPGFNGASAWLNSAPLTTATLRGKIVLVDFWTYSCINCLRSLPYVRAWWAAYHDKGLVIVGVHTPEFAFEKDLENVRKAVHELDVSYPVALDNEYRIWNAFHNEYWPAHYLIDVNGRIRYHHFGEGKYDETERAVQTLLAERNGTSATRLVQVTGAGVEREADGADMLSPETYLGRARARGFTGPDVPAELERNHWALDGAWKIGEERITLENGPGRILYRFHARDVHLVLGLPAGAAPVRFRVTIDGAVPGKDAGTDTNAQGYGTVREHRLYQLVRQQGAVTDRTVTIKFLGDGVQAYAFTFG